MRALPVRLAAAALALGIALEEPGWAMGWAPPAEERREGPTHQTHQDCYGEALDRAETVAIAREALEGAEGDTLEAVGTVLGDVRFVFTDLRQEVPRDAGGSPTEGGVSRNLTSRTRSESMFTLDQPVFQGFKEFAALGAAGSLREQRIQEILRAEHVLFGDVASSFYSVLRYRYDREAIEETHRILQERIVELRERETIGRSRPSEIATAEAGLKALEAELEESRGEELVAGHTLEFLTGIPLTPRHELVDEDALAGALGAFDARAAAEARPDVAALHEEMQVARQAVTVAQSEFWPHVNLEGNLYEKREGVQSGIDWDLLLRVDVPIFTGGTNLGAAKKAASEYEQARLSYELGRRQAELDIRSTYERWATSAARHRALQEAVGAYQRNYDLQKEEYERNLVSNLDVLQALRDLLAARREANGAYYDMKLNYWNYRIALGLCCAPEEAGS
jgi:outer membrane protein TolC